MDPAFEARLFEDGVGEAFDTAGADPLPPREREQYAP
jgi:hypothetical protein